MVRVALVEAVPGLLELFGCEIWVRRELGQLLLNLGLLFISGCVPVVLEAVAGGSLNFGAKLSGNLGGGDLHVS